MMDINIFNSYYLFNFSFINFPILKKGDFLTGTAIIEPVLGFLAILASLDFIPNEPKPLNSTRLFLAKDIEIFSKKTSTIFDISL